MELTQTEYELKDGVALIRLNRPDQLNAFTPVMREELIHLFQEADRDDAVRVVVITGNGRAFCAGADLSGGGSTFDRAQREGREIRLSEHRDGGGQVSLAVFNCRKPVIAAINGPAVGIGITMTLPMDIRIAAIDAKIGFVFARRGVVPEACSSWFLPRIVGISKAAELVLTGRIFRAAEEAHSGLFNHVLPPELVLSKALSVAREIADHTSAVSVTLSKALLWHGLAEGDPQSVHLIDSRVFFWAGKNPDAYEGVQSFLEKRPPKFPLSPTKDLPDFYPWWKEPKV
ncbi:MAG: crotonase/enoyl-CoA hydratase family protein [Deltaproteobacteria bacterium]|nr:crotonase/enoyl-CoA hydratase family protein [Deltaproteobacteria bacterium]